MLNSQQCVDAVDQSLLLRLDEILHGPLIRKDGQRKAFGHIVLDEVQDFNPAELSLIIGAVKKTKDLTLVGDTAQQIGDESHFPGWEKLRSYWNFEDEHSSYFSLTVSHRSTLPIMKLADNVQRRQTVSEGRKGRVPVWFRCRSEARGIQATLAWLRQAVERYPHDMTAVVCSTPAEAKFAYGMLEPTFGPSVRMGDNHSFSFDEGIVVTDVKQVKGLEFTNVLLWNPSAKTYPASRWGQNMLYVAITRAEENLAYVTWNKPSPFLPSATSRLVRYVPVGLEEEEEQQTAGR